MFTILKSSGNVGIGTVSPQARAHVSSNSTSSTSFVLENLVGAASRQLILSNYGSMGGGLYWPGLDSASTSSLLGPNLFVLRSTGGLAFSGSSTAEHMRISTNGNVGIGGAGDSSYRLRVINTNPNIFGTFLSTSAPIGQSFGLLVSAGTSPADIAFRVTNQSLQPILTVTGDGNVGIGGTLSPTEKLVVSGNAIVEGNGNFNQSVSILGQLSVHTMVTVGSEQVCLNGDLFTRCSSSSLRYKTNIGSFRSGLDVINRLRPITFAWKSDGRSDFGLGAEEVEKVAPELVFYRDGQVEGVKYDRIGVVLVNAVKEQQAQIETQQEQLKRQQKQINLQEDQTRRQRAAFAAQQQQIDALKKLLCRGHRRAAACR